MIEKVSKPVVVEGFGKMRQVANAFRRKGIVVGIGHELLLADAAVLLRHENAALLENCGEASSIVVAPAVSSRADVADARSLLSLAGRASRSRNAFARWERA
ncbi:hypothetical protein [Rhizobium bangladeshense]|uniref:hypothetical protein n=1 Tax=Rhizobium bangladeshense TaxID=1138189 RepID=UPI001C835A9A|nr:hypothetical protein [Rhizobium bangladeshense]MBX4889142.1 hypothetical protein [Rhizobium bangladeshense]